MAQKTGEDPHEIRRRGFTLTGIHIIQFRNIFVLGVAVVRVSIQPRIPRQGTKWLQPQAAETHRHDSKRLSKTVYSGDSCAGAASLRTGRLGERDEKGAAVLGIGSLSWPTDGKTKAEWRKKFPGVEFPEVISAAVKTANQGFLEAGATLKSDYDGLVKEYTKARNLERARQLREEMASLDKKPDAPRQRPGMVEGKPAPAKPVAKPLLDRIA